MSFGDLLWAMLVSFFLVMAIWVFLALYGDIFRRRDVSGGVKAGWCQLILVSHSSARCSSW